MPSMLACKEQSQTMEHRFESLWAAGEHFRTPCYHWFLGETKSRSIHVYDHHITGWIGHLVVYAPQLMLVNPGLKLKLLRTDMCRRPPPISVATGMVNLVSYRIAHTTSALNFFSATSEQTPWALGRAFLSRNSTVGVPLNHYDRASSFARGLPNAIKSTDQPQLSHLEFQLVNPGHVSFCALARQQLCRR